LEEVINNLGFQVVYPDVKLAAISDFSSASEYEASVSDGESVISSDGELEAEQVVERVRGAVVAEEGDTVVRGSSGQVSCASKFKANVDVAEDGSSVGEISDDVASDGGSYSVREHWRSYSEV